MKHTKTLTSLAQQLRKGMTKEEKQLWYQYLRKYPVQFKRQVTCGSYILDFYCPKAKLAIEVDGSQHYEPEAIEKDETRTHYLNSFGIYVFRISNRQIWEKFRVVCEQIDYLVQERTSSTADAVPLPQRGRLS